MYVGFAMWNALRGLFETTWKLCSGRDATIAVLFVVGSCLAVLSSWRQDVIYTDHRVLWYSILVVLYFWALVPPLAAMTKQHHKYVLYVVLWGLLSLAFVVVMFYLFYFALAVTADERTQWERVLNLPPVLAAAVAAAIGWYAAHQLAAKNHRTNNSFSLVMQTRCNAEFLKHATALSRTFPPPLKLTKAHAIYFPRDARQTFEDLQLKKKRGKNLTPEETKRLEAMEEHKLQAVEAAKYMLNFYEFVAYGIYANDLDEGLLYETISPAIVSLFQRTKELRGEVNGGPNGDKLSFEHLHRLVEGYDKEEHGKKMSVDGWAKRLELERAKA